MFGIAWYCQQIYIYVMDKLRGKHVKHCQALRDVHASTRRGENGEMEGEREGGH
jgi:hypothetical protein